MALLVFATLFFAFKPSPAPQPDQAAIQQAADGVEADVQVYSSSIRVWANDYTTAQSDCVSVALRNNFNQVVSTQVTVPQDCVWFFKPTNINGYTTRSTYYNNGSSVGVVTDPVQ